MRYFESRAPTLLTDPVGALDHVRGPAAADITVVEYGDFACPRCRDAHVILRDLWKRVPQVRLIFRANPRSHLFPMAPLAAEAAEAAAAQGKFWEMHDRLFENQDDLSEASLVASARALGLDMGRFEEALRTHAYAPVVHHQEVSGWHSHVLATPTFFINGVRFDEGPAELEEAIVRASQEARQSRLFFREVEVHTGEQQRRVSISVGRHQLQGDLPDFDGGDDAGPSPYDYLLAALGSCTAMTIKWAAERDNLALGKVKVRLSQSRTPTGHLFRRSVRIDAELTTEQVARLTKAVDSSPMTRTLGGEIAVDTRLVFDRTVDEAGEESFPASDPPSWTSGRNSDP